MTEDKKRKVHPIAERALEMATPGIDTIEFDDYAVEQIQDLLKERFGKPDLINAVLDLLNLATILDKQGRNRFAQSANVRKFTMQVFIKHYKLI